jgi:selenophosphate synthetase-related protein
MHHYPYDAKRRVEALIRSLGTVTARDPEQEVQGLAVPVMAAALEAIKRSKPDDPVVVALVDLCSVDVISADQPIRAGDMLIVAEQLDAAIGPYPLQDSVR